MARLLLAIVKSPENIPAMTKEELAYALLEDMQARLEQPINGMLNRHHVGRNLFSIGALVKRRERRECARSRQSYR
jgi:hypothetical protein